METLVIAEKPSVGRDIAKVLGAKTKGEGFLYGGGYVVSWAVGHLVELAEPEDYDPSYKRWKGGILPIIPNQMKLRPIYANRKQLSVVKGLLLRKDIGKVVCATDSGREGELIFRYIYRILGCSRPFVRLWISSMTDEAIREGFANLKDSVEYDSLYESARCRSEADWLVGINATRAFTLRYGTLLSLGRVQTPTLAILVSRQKEIEAFVAQEYYEVQTNFLSGSGSKYYGTYFCYINKDDQGKMEQNTRIMTLERAREIALDVGGNSGVIDSIDSQTNRQSAPLLYDLTELQREANRRYGYTAAKVLEAAQSLYERHKMITYPRTDSRHISADMAPKISGILRQLGAKYDFVADIEQNAVDAALREGGRLVDNAKVSDHHAIIPTGVLKVVASLSEIEAKIYDLVVRRFAQAFYPAYVYTSTSVITRVGEHLFISKGKVVIDEGWCKINPKSVKEEKKAEKKEEEQSLPNMEKGEDITCTCAEHKRKKTQPPKPYTEATLLSAMENAGRLVEDEDLQQAMKKSGLGTPATRAATIERLIQVGYVRRNQKTLAVTPKGVLLIDVVPPELKTPETTGRWEKGLISIAEGRLTSERFMQSIERYVKYIVDFTQQSGIEASFPEEPKKYSRRGVKRN